MSEIKNYMIRYKQKFMGEVLEDTYDVYDTFEGVCNREMMLYEDHHVFSVEIIELKG